VKSVKPDFWRLLFASGRIDTIATSLSLDSKSELLPGVSFWKVESAFRPLSSAIRLSNVIYKIRRVSKAAKFERKGSDGPDRLVRKGRDQAREAFIHIG